jgi:hypothetical protein
MRFLGRKWQKKNEAIDKSFGLSTLLLLPPSGRIILIPEMDTALDGASSPIARLAGDLWRVTKDRQRQERGCGWGNGGGREADFSAAPLAKARTASVEMTILLWMDFVVGWILSAGE